MMHQLSVNESKENSDDVWDDSLLVRAYDDSIRLVREELARRIALSTSKDVDCRSASVVSTSDINRDIIKNISPDVEYNVGDYVRATYEDGVDYEAKLISINQNTGKCFLKYIGYDNEQEMPLSNLIPSWGKKARRLQYAIAKLGKETDHTANIDTKCAKSSKRKDSALNFKTIPPPPPMPPMLSGLQNSDDSDHLSAMLMSWYMSGYYTGVYQGYQMAKASSKGVKK